jgi:hypothetical protein
MRTLLFILIGLITVASARAQELSPQEVKEAHKLYIGKCAKCHKLYDPHQYNDADWDAWMRKMTRKARLSQRQASLLSQYLAGIRAERMSATNQLPTSGN